VVVVVAAVGAAEGLGLRITTEVVLRVNDVAGEFFAAAMRTQENPHPNGWLCFAVLPGQRFGGCS